MVIFLSVSNQICDTRLIFLLIYGDILSSFCLTPLTIKCAYRMERLNQKVAIYLI